MFLEIPDNKGKAGKSLMNITVSQLAEKIGAIVVGATAGRSFPPFTLSKKPRPVRSAFFPIRKMKSSWKPRKRRR